tara:strand:+ start:387 stop:851 length:465 start_codon:yes stop_codon:yes gene_type:complete
MGMSAEAYGMLAIPMPVSSVPVSINPLRLNLRIRGRIRPPWTTTPINPMNAKTQPFSLSLQPRPPLSGSIEVNRMNVPCIMVKPTRNRKFTLTSAEMFGRRNTDVMLVKVSPSCEIGDFADLDLDSLGRLSGSMNDASIRAIADMALEKRHGSK